VYKNINNCHLCGREVQAPTPPLIFNCTVQWQCNSTTTLSVTFHRHVETQCVNVGMPLCQVHNTNWHWPGRCWVLISCPVQDDIQQKLFMQSFRHYCSIRPSEKSTETYNVAFSHIHVSSNHFLKIWGYAFWSTAFFWNIICVELQAFRHAISASER
jgi:hypothetical protein